MTENRKVVVTGLGAITPVGSNVSETWENLQAGVHGIGPITRFDTTGFKAVLAAEVKNFDPLSCLEVNESLRTDRYAQFSVAAAQEAVTESGIIGTLPPQRIGVCFGTGIGGIETFEKEHQKLMDRGPQRVSALFVPMMIANMASGLIAIRFGCQGPAMPAVTACASGANAIGEAMRMIRHGYVDAMIAGGAEAAITASAVAGFMNMHALSTATDPNAASLPFDRRREGFVMGEGATALVLEEYEHAKQRGAHIYGEVCGYGATCDAYHMTSPQPQGDGGARAMELALKEAAYTREDLVYINAHGTGTPKNDSTETLAIHRVLGEAAPRAFVSSTKSMTGHMLGAAGALEAMVCLKALEDGVLPPTINLKEPDEECDLFYIPDQAIGQKVTLALSNSLGFGGHNASLAFRKV